MVAGRKGRPADAAARRRQTTYEGRGGNEVDLGTPEVIAKRAALLPAGSVASPNQAVSFEFPLDVMLAHGMISKEQHAAGFRFALLAWNLFGFPCGSCAGLYERMVAPTIGDEDFAPRSTSMLTDEELSDKEREDREEFKAMLKCLRRGWSNLRHLKAVEEAAQYLRMPKYAIHKIVGADPSEIPPDDFSEFVALKSGLTDLVQLRSERRT